jgi:TolA-binding protein
MKPSTPAPLDREAVLRGLGSLAQKTWPDGAPASEDAAEKARFETALAGARTRRGSRTALVVAAAAMVACAALLVARTLWPSHLEYTVRESASNVGGFVQAGAVPATARFEEGTEIEVAPKGRARIVATDRHGARVALEQGRATLRVVHLPGAHWSVDAGPFTIAVTGTEFDAEWSGAEQRLVVELRRGSVVVRGPSANDGIGLTAGQRLVASVPDAQIHIEPLAPAAAPPPAPGVAGALPAMAQPAPATGSRETSTDIVGRGAPAPSGAQATQANATWEQLVRAGDYESVVRDAKGRGVDAVLREGSRGDLSAFADAARYTGAVDLADHALAALERRYPDSADAKAAPFYRGRLAEGRGARSEAVALYDRYLSESPHGAFAAEALGRKMLVVRDRDGADSARAVARDYLVRFPRGPYAETARKLVDSE